MKIAIPTFATRVSPRFDCAQSVLVVTVDDGDASERRELSAGDWAPHERVDRLLELGVDTVICGGIDCWSVASLQSAGVTVYGWITGEIEDALAALLQGNLDSDAEMEDGGRCACRIFPGDDDEQDQPSGSGRGRRRRRGRERGGTAGPRN
jgi:predicted Fe-Mo cluster-binding NifX family protein